MPEIHAFHGLAAISAHIDLESMGWFRFIFLISKSLQKKKENDPLFPTLKLSPFNSVLSTQLMTQKHSLYYLSDFCSCWFETSDGRKLKTRPGTHTHMLLFLLHVISSREFQPYQEKRWEGDRVVFLKVGSICKLHCVWLVVCALLIFMPH